MRERLSKKVLNPFFRVVSFEIGNLQEAHEAFQKCYALDRKDSFIPAWLEKCKSTPASTSKPAPSKPAPAKTEPAKPTPSTTTSSSSSSSSSASSSSSSASAPRPPQPARSPAPMAPKAPRAPKVSAQPAPKPTPVAEPTPEPVPTPAAAPAQNAPPPSAQRYTWFQNDNFVVVTVFVKGAKQENVAIDFEAHNLSVNVQLSSDNQFLLDLDLAHDIDSAQSKYEIMSTKIEIKLKKAVPTKWDTIERKEEVAPPPAKKQNKNWDKILAGEEEDKDTGFNQLMRDMYSGASEDERRAMMKSFHESGGTVLSCDWKDVGKGFVDPKPPVGVTKWEKDAVS